MNTNTITIVGGGSSGWMTAAFLIRTFPEKEITVIESSNIPIIGVGESTLIDFTNFRDYLGIEEKDFMKKTNASYKMSIKFTDFYEKDSGSFHYPFGRPLTDDNRNCYSDWYFKKYYYPDTPVEDFVRCLFPAAALFENNKYSENEYGQFDNFDPQNDVAYHFDAVKFGNWLREHICIPRKVKHISKMVIDVITSETGIDKLILEDQSEITADLYIDCTGFQSLLISKSLSEPFISYSDMLPNNKAWATRIPYKDRSKELEGYTFVHLYPYWESSDEESNWKSLSTEMKSKLFIDAIKKLPKVLKRYFRKFGKLKRIVFRPRTSQMGRIYSLLLPKLLISEFKNHIVHATLCRPHPPECHELFEWPLKRGIFSCFSADVDKDDKNEVDDGFESRPPSVAKQSSVCIIQ
jgi:hypothetical protein